MNDVRPLILVTWTTRYREGGRELTLAARTLAAEQRAAGVEVWEARVESKADFVAALARVRAAGKALKALHFLGHSGMYGPMFRTSEMPEQFSPHEWRSLEIPFAPGAEAFFHACRTGRWFTAFFARTFGVRAWGYHWYTTFSRSPQRFVWPGPWPRGPLYLVGCRGRKSDGLLGSVAKYAGLMPIEPMRAAEAVAVGAEAGYDGVAARYGEVFEDIRVRGDEWRWLKARWPAGGACDVLDLGCGTGSLLAALGDTVRAGHGVDVSAGMIAEARRRNRKENIAFTQISGPSLPFPDASFDVAVSFLSWRYLDWDPIMAELQRVLRPGGRLLVVDMVTAPLATREWPAFLQDSVKAFVARRRDPRFREALTRLTRDPAWKTMLRYNPIRAQHEYVWYFESRFPGRRVERLNVGWDARVLAFDSGPLPRDRIAPQTWP
jgi:ubiquinone/menaquinone biosynthesis C-methylase UbiE